MNLIKTIVSLIRTSIDENYTFVPQTAFSSEDYFQIYKFAKKHELLNLVTFGLQKANLMPENRELFQKFQQGLLFAAYRVEQIELAQKGAIEILKENILVSQC